MLQPEYIRDMNYNYLVFKGKDNSASFHGIKMLLNNTIPGILRMELRCIDTLDLYYYDITSLKSLSTVYEKESLSYHTIKNLMAGILNTIKGGSQFLLSENDYLIRPEFIYMDAKENIRLCHMVGFKEDIFGQITKLLEYLLNKVDYKEEAAVLLVYALYKESREQNTTFDKFHEILNKQFTNEILVKKITMEVNKENLLKEQSKNIPENTVKPLLNNTVVSNKSSIKNTESNRNLSKQGKGLSKQSNGSGKLKSEANKGFLIKEKNKNQVNSKLLKSNLLTKKKEQKLNQGGDEKTGEEIENQREYQFYGVKTFLFGGLSLAGGITCFILGFAAKLFYNNLGTGIDPVKLLSCIVVLICLEGYIIAKLFDSKNKQTKYLPLLEYTKTYTDASDVRQDNQRQPNHFKENHILDSQHMLLQAAVSKETDYNNSSTGESQSQEGDNATAVLWKEDLGQEDIEKTVILAHFTQKKQYYIVSISQNNTEEGKTDNDTNILEVKSEEDVSEGKLQLVVPIEKGRKEVVRGDDVLPVRVEIMSFPFSIGKQDRGNQLVIKHSTISRKHAVITKEGEKLYLTDLCSTNGTYVNGKPLIANQPFEVTEFDEIRFSMLSYHLEVFTNQQDKG